MTLIQQIMWGSVFLCACLLLETVLLVGCGEALRRHKARVIKSFTGLRHLEVVLISIVCVLIAHTVQIWIWSAALMLKAGIFDDWNTAVYFSLATYTTLGYGDVVLNQDHRIFAAFEAMTGMLGFGISTAFLVGIMRPIFVGGAFEGERARDAHLDN